MVTLGTNGCLLDISSMYCGLIADADLFQVSRFVEHLPSDHPISVLLDKGFLVGEKLAERMVVGFVPPCKTREVPQFAKETMIAGKRIAKTRVHVERVISVIKQWKAASMRWPLTMVDVAERAFFVRGFLSLFAEPQTFKEED